MSGDDNAAVVPDPPQPQERSYRVSGVQPTLGHEPGEEFTATLPLEQEALLLAAGAIERADADAEPESEREPDPDDLKAEKPETEPDKPKAPRAAQHRQPSPAADDTTNPANRE